MSQEAPTFSILCAAYQAEDTISRAVGSVLAQEEAGWELIVCDDGSGDATGAAALQAAAGDDRVRVLRQQNSGPGAARNAAAAQARGEYLCILDSDDEMLPGYLSAMLGLIASHPEADIISCNARVVDPSGAESLWAAEAVAGSYSLDLSEMLERNRIFVMATVRAEAFARVDGFDESSFVEDYDLWLRILASDGAHVGTRQPLGIYHRRADAASASAAQQWQATSELLQRYANDNSLDTSERQTARTSVSRYAAMANLDALDPGSPSKPTRQECYAMLAAYDSTLRRGIGRVLITASPSLFARVVVGRRKAALAQRYGAGGVEE